MEKEKIIQFLKEARQLITPAGAWCQNASALDAQGALAGPTLPNACAWCATGAVERVGRQAGPFLLGLCFAALADTIQTEIGVDLRQFIALYNDTHTHSEILAWFDQTIIRLEAP